MELAKKHDITVIEDAAHAFGGQYKGKMLGTIGHFGAFSFHEVKNITSLGEGGILCSNDLPFGQRASPGAVPGAGPLARRSRTGSTTSPAFKGKGGYFAAATTPRPRSRRVVPALADASGCKSIIAKRSKAAEYLTRALGEVDGIITPPLATTRRSRRTHHLYLLQVDPARSAATSRRSSASSTDRGRGRRSRTSPRCTSSASCGSSAMTPQAIEASARWPRRPSSTASPTCRSTTSTEEQLEYMADAVIDAVGEMKKGR